MLLSAMGAGDLLAIQMWYAPRLLVVRDTAIRALNNAEWVAPLAQSAVSAEAATEMQPVSVAPPLAPPLYFERDAYHLHSGHRWLLQRVVEKAREKPQRSILIRGHADRTGPAGWNKTLSYKRAHCVAKFLRNHGIDGRRLIVQAYGAKRPVDPQADAAMNRRVEVLWR